MDVLQRGSVLKLSPHNSSAASLSSFGYNRTPKLKFSGVKNLVMCQVARATYEGDRAKLVKDSYQILKKDAGKHASAFFLKVFEIAPTVKQLFSFMRDTDVLPERNTHLKAHALNVFTTTCEAAVQLGDDPSLGALKPKLLEMGHTHVGHRVVDEHFDVVGYALLETLKDALKEKWTPEMKSAWGEAYSAVTKVIKDEMHAVRASSKASGLV